MVDAIWVSFSINFVRNIPPINIKRVTVEMGAETHTGFHLKCPLMLSDFNRNRRAEIDVNNASGYQIS
jgi:hypothetical protein